MGGGDNEVLAFRVAVVADGDDAVPLGGGAGRRGVIFPGLVRQGYVTPQQPVSIGLLPGLGDLAPVIAVDGHAVGVADEVEGLAAREVAHPELVADTPAVGPLGPATATPAPVDLDDALAYHPRRGVYLGAADPCLLLYLDLLDLKLLVDGQDGCLYVRLTVLVDVEHAARHAGDIIANCDPPPNTRFPADFQRLQLPFAGGGHSRTLDSCGVITNLHAIKETLQTRRLVWTLATQSLVKGSAGREQVVIGRSGLVAHTDDVRHCHGLAH